MNKKLFSCLFLISITTSIICQNDTDSNTLFTNTHRFTSIESTNDTNIINFYSAKLSDIFNLRNNISMTDFEYEIIYYSYSAYFNNQKLTVLRIKEDEGISATFVNGEMKFRKIPKRKIKELKNIITTISTPSIIKSKFDQFDGTDGFLIVNKGASLQFANFWMGLNYITTGSLNVFPMYQELIDYVK